MISIPCRALPRRWEEANAAKNWAEQDTVPGGCGCWKGMSKPESIGEGQHFCTMCLQLFGTNAKWKRWTIFVTFPTCITIFLVYRSGSLPHASTDTGRAQLPPQSNLSQRSSFHTWNISSVGTRLTRGHQWRDTCLLIPHVQLFKNAHPLSTALDSCHH